MSPYTAKVDFPMILLISKNKTVTVIATVSTNECHELLAHEKKTNLKTLIFDHCPMVVTLFVSQTWVSLPVKP